MLLDKRDMWWSSSATPKRESTLGGAGWGDLDTRNAARAAYGTVYCHPAAARIDDDDNLYVADEGFLTRVAVYHLPTYAAGARERAPNARRSPMRVAPRRATSSSDDRLLGLYRGVATRAGNQLFVDDWITHAACGTTTPPSRSAPRRTSSSHANTKRRPVLGRRRPGPSLAVANRVFKLPVTDGGAGADRARRPGLLGRRSGHAGDR